jgi:RNA polymerase sigma-70 factor (ECF subfamily)
MQQAYVNAFTHLRQFNGSARFPTWLTRIAINEALARVRHQRRYETFNEDSNVEPLMPPNPAENPERHAFTGELRNLLEWAIDALPSGMREVFVLRDVQGLSTAEVAECLDVSEDVVKTRLSRGRAALRALLMERTARDRIRSLSLLSSSLRSGRCAGSRTNPTPVSIGQLSISAFYPPVTFHAATTLNSDGGSHLRSPLSG